MFPWQRSRESIATCDSRPSYLPSWRRSEPSYQFCLATVAALSLTAAVIEGVLLDSGGVLMGPRGGRWWPIYGFERIVRAHCPTASFASLESALVPAMAYMARTHPHEDWREFNRFVVEGIGVEPTDAMLDEIAAIRAVDAVEVFEDVVPCLEALRARAIRMAVVSDAWPDLPELHADLGIRRFFEGYAISSVLACTKPDPRMYAEGARILGLPPEKLLFVDDRDDLVDAALELGYRGVALCRSGAQPRCQVPWITSLDALTSHL
jgi:putative hydrolase of the HAD superfamily